MSLHINTSTPAFHWGFPPNESRVWTFRANHRFVREIEDNDPQGRSYLEAAFADDGTAEYWHRLFWALTITHRTHEDPCSFEEFLEMLPHGSDYLRMQQEALRIVSEFFRTTGNKKEPPQPLNERSPSETSDEGNLPPAPSEPVPQTGDSSTDSSSSTTE